MAYIAIFNLIAFVVFIFQHFKSKENTYTIKEDELLDLLKDSLHSTWKYFDISPALQKRMLKNRKFDYMDLAFKYIPNPIEEIQLRAVSRCPCSVYEFENPSDKVTDRAVTIFIEGLNKGYDLRLLNKKESKADLQSFLQLYPVVKDKVHRRRDEIKNTYYWANVISPDSENENG